VALRLVGADAVGADEGALAAGAGDEAHFGEGAGGAGLLWVLLAPVLEDVRVGLLAAGALDAGGGGGGHFGLFLPVGLADTRCLLPEALILPGMIYGGAVASLEEQEVE
jgi:hypothetical protein